MRTFLRHGFSALLAVLSIFAINHVFVGLSPDGVLQAVTIGATVQTLADWGKKLDPDGKVPDIIEMLEQTNEMLPDMLWQQGNLPTGHRATIRTGLPAVYWRIINQPVPTSKSTTAQVDENTAMMEAWSEVDVELANLNGNTAAFRLSEAQAFIEAMNQEMQQTLLYGNAGLAPEEFTGLSTRYSSLSAANGDNIVNGGGVGSDNTSIWLIVWGANTVSGLFPKGSKAGLDHQDHGEQTIAGSTGVGGTRMRVFQDQWTWKVGLLVKDWRYAVRVANLDVSLIRGDDASSPHLVKNLIKAVHKIPALGMGRAAIYMNRTVFQYLDIQRLNNVSAGGGLTYENVDGKILPTFRGIPIRRVDQILNTEAAVA
jgi:hypothetical protein